MVSGRSSLSTLPLTGREQGLRNGDYIYVPRLKPSLDSAVMLDGNVYTAGIYEYHPGCVSPM